MLGFFRQALKGQKIMFGEIEEKRVVRDWWWVFAAVQNVNETTFRTSEESLRVQKHAFPVPAKRPEANSQGEQ